MSEELTIIGFIVGTLTAWYAVQGVLAWRSMAQERRQARVDQLTKAHSEEAKAWRVVHHANQLQRDLDQPAGMTPTGTPWIIRAQVVPTSDGTYYLCGVLDTDKATFICQDLDEAVEEELADRWEKMKETLLGELDAQ